MKHKIKDLLIIAMEESAEIAQACSKAIRFGLRASDPYKNKKETHDYEILTEYYQLQSIIEELQQNGTLPYFTEDRINNIKKNKISKLYKYMDQTKNK